MVVVSASTSSITGYVGQREEVLKPIPGKLYQFLVAELGSKTSDGRSYLEDSNVEYNFDDALGSHESSKNEGSVGISEHQQLGNLFGDGLLYHGSETTDEAFEEKLKTAQPAIDESLGIDRFTAFDIIRGLRLQKKRVGDDIQKLVTRNGKKLECIVGEIDKNRTAFLCPDTLQCLAYRVLCEIEVQRHVRDIYRNTKHSTARETATDYFEKARLVQERTRICDPCVLSEWEIINLSEVNQELPPLDLFRATKAAGEMCTKAHMHLRALYVYERFMMRISTRFRRIQKARSTSNLLDGEEQGYCKEYYEATHGMFQEIDILYDVFREQHPRRSTASKQYPRRIQSLCRWLHGRSLS